MRPTIQSVIVAAFEAAKAKGYSQADLARDTGLTKARVSEILSGKIDPRLSSVERIVVALSQYIVIKPKASRRRTPEPRP